jgi:hypothetical protein
MQSVWRELSVFEIEIPTEDFFIYDGLPSLGGKDAALISLFRAAYLYANFPVALTTAADLYALAAQYRDRAKQLRAMAMDLRKVPHELSRSAWQLGDISQQLADGEAHNIESAAKFYEEAADAAAQLKTTDRRLVGRRRDKENLRATPFRPQSCGSHG